MNLIIFSLIHSKLKLMCFLYLLRKFSKLGTMLWGVGPSAHEESIILYRLMCKQMLFKM